MKFRRLDVEQVMVNASNGNETWETLARIEERNINLNNNKRLSTYEISTHSIKMADILPGNETHALDGASEYVAWMYKTSKSGNNMLKWNNMLSDIKVELHQMERMHLVEANIARKTGDMSMLIKSLTEDEEAKILLFNLVLSDYAYTFLETRQTSPEISEDEPVIDREALSFELAKNSEHEQEDLEYFEETGVFPERDVSDEDLDSTIAELRLLYAIKKSKLTEDKYVSRLYKLILDFTWDNSKLQRKYDEETAIFEMSTDYIYMIASMKPFKRPE